jgi:predicted ATPase
MGFCAFSAGKAQSLHWPEMALSRLDEWRSKEAPPALLITGEPGIGKSAIVAALVDQNPEGQVLAYHCCRA